MEKECELYTLISTPDKTLKCLACCHKCLIKQDKTGICGVRKNIDGRLYLLVYGKVAAMHIDPIEKKPIYHFLPNTSTFSIGTFGCNFKCDWCQNFDISQATKEKSLKVLGKDTTPKEVVNLALKSGCKSISYTYNEPAIFVEFAKDCAELAKSKGLKNILVTNGYFSKESFVFIKDFIDAANIDLKSLNKETYEKFCGAKLENVLENIKMFYKAGIHIELTTLIIPRLNDSDEELRSIAEFIASIDKNIPWHISRFSPLYKMQNKNTTPLETINKAYEIGKQAGLTFVHKGNV